MPYSKRIVCLANSYKAPSGRCVAGIEVFPQGRRGPWVRPVSDRPEAELKPNDYSYADRTPPKLLDIVEIAFLTPAPRGHQRENHLIDPSARWRRIGTFPFWALTTLVDNPPALWLNEDHTTSGVFDCLKSSHASGLPGSLSLIQVVDLEISVGTNPRSGKEAFRGTFSYRATGYNFSITDPAVREKYGARGKGVYDIGEAFLCVSLTEKFDDGRCHKLIAGVITKHE